MPRSDGKSRAEPFFAAIRCEAREMWQNLRTAVRGQISIF